MVKEKFLLIAVFLCLTACPKKNPETPAPVDSVPPISEDGGDMPGDSRKADVAEPVLPKPSGDAAAPSLEGGGEDTPGGSSKADVAEPVLPKPSGDAAAPSLEGGGEDIPGDSAKADVAESALPKPSGDAAAPSLEGKASGDSSKADVAEPVSEEDFVEISKIIASEMGFEIQWDDMIHSRVFQSLDLDDVSLLNVYLFYAIGSLDRNLKEGRTEQVKEQFTHLCKSPDCETGLDITKINSDAIHLILYEASLEDPKAIKIFDKAGKPTETMVFLQGQLSPTGWSPTHYQQDLEMGIIKKPADVIHIQIMKRALSQAHNIREVLVNLPYQFGPEPGQHYDANVFIELGRFIRERNLSLRVVGSCGTYCVNYLLPAAQAVIIESYGYIYTEGSIHGLFEGGRLAAVSQFDYQLQELKEEWLPKMNKPESGAEGNNRLVEYVRAGMLLSFGLVTMPGTAEKTRIQQRNMVNLFLENLRGFGQSKWESGKWEAFSTHVTEYQGSVNRSIRDWERKDIEGFIQSINNDKQGYFLEGLALYMQIYNDEKTKRWSGYLSHLVWTKKYTTPYRNEMESSLISQTSYNYGRLLDLIPHLIKDTLYEIFFNVPKTYYPAPEEEKPYVAVLSAGLLRLLGMNVIGENNRDMISKMWQDRVLYLDEKVIQNCKFFESLDSHINKDRIGQSSQPAYTRETFNDCVSRSED